MRLAGRRRSPPRWDGRGSRWPGGLPCPQPRQRIYQGGVTSLEGIAERHSGACTKPNGEVGPGNGWWRSRPATTRPTWFRLNQNIA